MSAPPPRNAGFRFFPHDAIALVLGAGIFVALWRVAGPLAWIVVMAYGHFFLFCNIVRMRRSYELIWTGVFLTNFIWWSRTGEIPWPPILAIQLPLTAVLSILEIRSPRYHGVFAEKLNKRLPEYLSGATF